MIVCTNKIYTYVLEKSYFIFPITKGSVTLKGSVNALMKHAGFGTSNKVKKHWNRHYKSRAEVSLKHPLTSCVVLNN